MLPTSLIMVAIGLGWLVVLVPLIVRKRQAIARTVDSVPVAQVMWDGSVRAGAREEVAMRDAEMTDDEVTADDPDGNPILEERIRGAAQRNRRRVDIEEQPRPEWAELDGVDDADDLEDLDDDLDPPQRYRPGRGGYDPEAAALTAQAKYAFRQRVVVVILLLAIASAFVAGVVTPLVWWAHGGIVFGLLCYLVYLRRQVRIEEEIRQRRLVRMAHARRSRAAEQLEREDEEPYLDRVERHDDVVARPMPPHTGRPGAIALDIDDEDPAFDELEDPDILPYRRAVGE
jgi:hypothetical protein